VRPTGARDQGGVPGQCFEVSIQMKERGIATNGDRSDETIDKLAHRVCALRHVR